MSRALWDQLKAKQIAFLRARLVSEEAARDFRARLPDGWTALLATPLGQLADADAVNRALDAALTEPFVARTVRPAARAALVSLVAAARAEQSRAGEFVPERARPKIDRLLARPKILPERLMREVLESDAMEEVMHDVLFSVLKEFSQKVNPFVAEWGLPSLFKKLSPFGLGGVGKGLESMRAEFEKRSEPEMRKFLRTISRQALRDTTDALITRADEPKFVALRKHVAAWALEQQVAAHLTLDDEGTALAEEIGVDVLEHNLTREALASRRRAAVSAFIAAHRDLNLRAVLARHGITVEPDFDAIAAVLWPLVRSACESPPVQAWLESLVTEFFDSLPDELG